MTIKSITLSLALAVSAAFGASAQTSYDDPRSQALMKAFDELLEEDPRDPDTLVRRAELYYAHQDYIKAIDDVNTAMKYYEPGDEEARYPAYQVRAKIYQRQKKYSDALADLNQVLTMSPQDYGTIYQRAQVLYELGRYQEANADYNLMLRLNPRSQDALLGLARVAVKQNNLGTANDIADRAVSITPNRSEIYIGRASVRHLMGNEAGAVEDYITAISTDNYSTGTALRHLVDLSRSDYPTVMAGLSAAISKAPRNGMFYFIRAMIAQGHCNYLAALADYDKIINENLDSYPGLNGALAECYYYLGRYDRALLNADYAISATDDNEFYYVIKSRILRATGDSEGALSAADKALDKSPEDIEALVAKALAQVDLGQLADASVALSEAAMVNPENPELQILRGWVLGDYRKQQANAERAYEMVLDMDFDFDNGRSFRGFALLALDRKEQADNWMQRVLDTADDYDGAVNYYATCYYSQAGMPERALKCMEVSLEKGYANYHNWTKAAEANINCAPLRDDARFKALLEKYAHLFK